MRKIMLLTILLALVVFLVPAHADKVKDVKIVNDLVPVTGDIKATVKGVVDATVTGNVNVVNTPDVNVVNDSTNPVPVTVHPDGLSVNVSTVYRFVGVSAAKTKGCAGEFGCIGGFRTMHKLCQDTYGGLSRMCTTEEYWKSTSLKSHPTAWIQPVIVQIFLDESEPAGNTLLSFDITGTGFGVSLEVNPFIVRANCLGWALDSDRFIGATVHHLGAINSWPCDQSFNVACCLPASQQPE